MSARSSRRDPRRRRRWQQTSPEELIAACFATALGSILAARRIPPEQLRVTATVTLETSGTPTIASGQLAAHGVVPGADATAFDQELGDRRRMKREHKDRG